LARRDVKEAAVPQYQTMNINQAVMAAVAVVAACIAAPASATTLSRSVDVAASPDTVWAAVGGFCAIGEWHPAIASCREDGKTPSTRTLITKDGAKFVELRTGRSARQYAYTFLSSPVPVSHYLSTFRVTGKGDGGSTITWSSVYTPDAGKAEAAEAALTGIYESGLAAIKAKLSH